MLKTEDYSQLLSAVLCTMTRSSHMCEQSLQSTLIVYCRFYVCVVFMLA